MNAEFKIYIRLRLVRNIRFCLFIKRLSAYRFWKTIYDIKKHAFVE